MTHQPQLDSKKAQILSDEVNKLFQKTALVPAIKDGTGFVSSVFVVPKAGGQWCPVINLKALNHFVMAPNFKIELMKTVKCLIQKDDWLTKLDLKNAYLSVPVNPCYQKYFKFHWLEQLWQFTVLPFGLNSAPYIFTKLMEPVVATLRRLGIRMSLYLNDMIRMADSQGKAREHLRCTTNPLEHGQEYNITKSANRILRIHFGLQHHDDIPTIPEIDLTSKTNSTTSRWEKDTERECTSVSNDGNSPPNYSISPTILDTWNGLKLFISIMAVPKMIQCQYSMTT